MEKKAGDPNGFSGEKSPQSLVIPDRGEATIDHFYEKLGKLNESSGLSLVWVSSIIVNLFSHLSSPLTCIN